jgi:hypothetical protein
MSICIWCHFIVCNQEQSSLLQVISRSESKVSMSLQSEKIGREFKASYYRDHRMIELQPSCTYDTVFRCVTRYLFI